VSIVDPDHAAVDVDRQLRQPEPLHGLHDERVVEVDERLERCLRELLQPVADGASRGDA